MLMRIAFIALAGLALGIDMASAKSRHHRHHPEQAAAAVQQRVLDGMKQKPYSGGTLVLHPAWNIACMTRDRATRALPCDQPVWVYGSPCEIDLGLGRYRSCD